MRTKLDNARLNNNDPYFNVKMVLPRDLNKSNIFTQTGTYLFEQIESDYQITIEIRYRRIKERNDVFEVTVTKAIYNTASFSTGHCIITDGTISCFDSFVEAVHKAINYKDWREKSI